MYSAQIYTALSAHAGTSAIVSNRIYPLKTQGVLPAIAYQLVSTEYFNLLSGTYLPRAQDSYEITLEAKSYAEIQALLIQAKIALTSATNLSCLINDTSEFFDDETASYVVVLDVWITI